MLLIGIFFVSAVRDLVSTKEARNKPHERQYDHYRKGWTKCLLGHKIFFIKHFLDISILEYKIKGKGFKSFAHSCRMTLFELLH